MDSPSQAPTLATVADSGARILLQGIRRIGTGGLHDADTAQRMIGAFGLSFRRPLVLLRTMMAELAHISHRPITIAPASCHRMTIAESMLLAAIARAEEKPALAEDIFRRLCGVEQTGSLLTCAQALARAFADQGRPIEP